MSCQVHVSGEIHTDWRDRIVRGSRDAGLDVEFTGPVTDHAAGDDCGVEVDRAALAVAREPGQVVALLRYVIEGKP